MPILAFVSFLVQRKDLWVQYLWEESVMLVLEADYLYNARTPDSYKPQHAWLWNWSQPRIFFVGSHMQPRQECCVLHSQGCLLQFLVSQSRKLNLCWPLWLEKGFCRSSPLGELGAKCLLVESHRRARVVLKLGFMEIFQSKSTAFSTLQVLDTFSTPSASPGSSSDHHATSCSSPSPASWGKYSSLLRLPASSYPVPPTYSFQH